MDWTPPEAAQSPGKSPDWKPPEADAWTPPEAQITPPDVHSLIADPNYNAAQHAAENPAEKETAFQARQELRHRTVGEKVAAAGSTLLEPATYGHAATGALKFAGGLVATPLHTIAQMGATIGAPIAGAIGATGLQNTLENEQQTQGAEAVLGAQQIEQNLGGMARGVRNYYQGIGNWTGISPEEEATERAHFEEEIAAYKAQQALAQNQPLDTGAVAAASRLATGHEPGETFSPEALAAQGARSASHLVAESMAAAADPTNLALPYVAKLPGVATLAGGAVEGLGKALQIPAKGLAYIPKIGRMAAGAPTAATIIEGALHPALAAKAAAAAALGKTLGWIGEGMEQQGNALRTGAASALDKTVQAASTADTRAIGANAQRLAGQLPAHAISTALGFAPVNTLTSGGDPRAFAESEVGAGVMGAMFALPGETFARGNALRRIAAQRLAGDGAQQFSDDAAYPAHQAQMAAMQPAYRDAINRLRSYLFRGTGTDVLVLDGASYAAKTQGIGEDTRGHFAREGKTIYLNADSLSKNPLGAAGHETGHAIVDFLQTAGHEADANGLFESIRRNLTPEQMQTMADAYHEAVLRGTKDQSPENRAKIIAANPAEKIVEENLSEITRKILSGEDVSGFAVPKPLLERITEAAAGWMERRGLTPNIDPKAELGFKTQMVKETARRMKSVLYEVGKTASAEITKDEAGGQKVGERIAELTPIAARPITDRTSMKERAETRFAQRELAELRGETGTQPQASPTPAGTPQQPPAQAPLNRYRIAAILRHNGLNAAEATQWANAAEGDSDEHAVVDSLRKRAQAKFPTKQASPAPQPSPAQSAPPPASGTPAAETAPGDISPPSAQTARSQEPPPEPARAEAAPVAEPAPSTTILAAHPIEEVPVAHITLSADVPNFKEDADAKTGVVRGQELQGRYERLGSAPIVLWRRLNGDLEIITGRHRLDLARRSGEKTIPAQIVDEAQGFTRDMALTFDAEANIKDGQGTIKDYAHYFRNSPQIDESLARARGLLSRAKGKAGFDLGRHASDDLYALYAAGRLSEESAVEIARAAPGNDALQQIGTKAALEGKTPEFIGNLIKAVRAATRGRSDTLDLFGADDSAMQAMEAQAKEAGRMQTEIRNRIRAIQNAAKNPEVAAQEGIDVRDPAAVLARVAALKAELARWENWPMHPDLVAKTRGEEISKASPTQPSHEPAPSEPPPSQPLPPGGSAVLTREGEDHAAAGPIPVSEPHTRGDFDRIAAQAREALLNDKTPAKSGKNKGEHTKENQRLADRAAFDAAAAAHAATVPENYQGIRQRTDAFGRTTISGTVDPARHFDGWLIDRAEASGMLPEGALKTLLALQMAIGTAISYDYGHAKVRPQEKGEMQAAHERAASQAENTVGKRLSGEAEQDTARKTSVPLRVEFNPGKDSFTVYGVSQEKLLNNFNHLAEKMGDLDLPLPFRDINDPKFVAAFKAVIRNHEHGWTGDGARPSVGTTEFPNSPDPEWKNSPERTVVPKDQFEFINALLADESAKPPQRGDSSPAKAKAKAALAVENRIRVPDAEPGETNALRRDINKASAPVEGKSWSRATLEDPLNENISPALTSNIGEPSQADESIRQHGKVGDISRFFDKGKTPDRAKTAAGFMPEEESEATKSGKRRAAAALGISVEELNQRGSNRQLARLRELSASGRTLSVPEQAERDRLERGAGQKFMDFAAPVKSDEVKAVTTAKERAAQRIELERRKNARLIGGDIETQPDLLGPTTDKSGNLTLFMPEEKKALDQIAESAGVVYQGQSNGLHAFKELTTNGNFSLKSSDLTPESIQKKADEVRKSFSEEEQLDTPEKLEKWMRDQGMNFLPETTMRDDNSAQAKWLDKEARAQGFAGLGDLLEKDPAQRTKLMAQWRQRHPRDAAGNYLQNKGAEAINRVLYGAKKPDGNQPLQGGVNGRAAAPDTLTDAIAHSGGGQRAGGVSEGEAREREHADSLAGLVKWAVDSGLKIDGLPKRFDTADPKTNHGGKEHDAWFDEPSGRWLKTTKGASNAFGIAPVVTRDVGIELAPATAAEYLRGREVWNEVFGDDIRLHGLLISKDGKTAKIVTSQPDIAGSRKLSQLDIDTQMERDGFLKFNEACYWRKEDNTAVFDLHDENGVMAGGQFVPFDGVAVHPDARLREAIKDARFDILSAAAKGDPAEDWRRGLRESSSRSTGRTDFRETARTRLRTRATEMAK